MSPQLPPEGISQQAWDEARAAYAGNGVASEYEHTLYVYERIARAIMAATEGAEKHWADAMKDPVAVRVNYLRGNVACQPLIDEAAKREREECAITLEALADEFDSQPAWALYREAAAAIRQGSQPSNAILLKGVVR